MRGIMSWLRRYFREPVYRYPEVSLGKFTVYRAQGLVIPQNVCMIVMHREGMYHRYCWV